MIALRHIVHTLTLALGERVRLRDGGEQRFGIGMHGMGIELVALGQLHHLAVIHDADAVREILDHAEVVRDEHDGQAQFILQVIEQVDHLRLNGHVQGGHGFIGDNELGSCDYCPRNADALALAAGKLMRIPGGMLFREPHLFQCADDLAVHFLLVQAAEHEALADDLLNGHSGIQGINGILKDHGHGRGDEPGKVLVQFPGQVPALELHASAGGVVQPDNGAAGGGLSAAALAHKPEGLTGIDVKGYVVHGLDRHLVLSVAAGEVLTQMLHLQNGFTQRRQPPSFSGFVPSGSQACLPSARRDAAAM